MEYAGDSGRQLSSPVLCCFGSVYQFAKKIQNLLECLRTLIEFNIANLIYDSWVDLYIPFWCSRCEQKGEGK